MELTRPYPGVLDLVNAPPKHKSIKTTLNGISTLCKAIGTGIKASYNRLVAWLP